MPSELLEESLSSTPWWLNFAREPTSADWEAFCKHAHRVRRFCCNGSYGNYLESLGPSGSQAGANLGLGAVDAISRGICQLAQGRSASPLFPDLRNLELPLGFPLQRNRRTLMRYVPFLAGDKLQVLRFETDAEGMVAEGETEHAPEGDIIPMLKISYPNLQVVDIHNCSNGVVDFLTGLNDMRKLSASVAYKEFDKLLAHLPVLPRLSHLYLRAAMDFDKSVGSAVVHIPQPCFTALESLSLDDLNIKFVVHLLGALAKSTTLRSVSANVRGDTQGRIASAFSKVSVIPRLEKLAFSFSDDVSAIDIPPLLTASLLRQLHSLSCLRKLTLTGTSGVVVTDTDLVSLTTCCPFMEEIRITCSVGSGQDLEPQITLGGLATIRHARPLINYLHFAVSGSILPASTAQITPTNPASMHPLNLVVAHGSGSPDLDPADAARMIVQRFPNLKDFTGEGYYWQDVGEEVNMLLE